MRKSCASNRTAERMVFEDLACSAVAERLLDAIFCVLICMWIMDSRLHDHAQEQSNGPSILQRPRAIFKIALLQAGNQYSMARDTHNPDQYMSSLRQIIAQGRKRIGLLVGAGAPAGIPGADGKTPLIPTVKGLTDKVLSQLKPTFGPCFDAMTADIGASSDVNIEAFLSRVRSLAGVIGSTKVHGLDGSGYGALGDAICKEISAIVNQALPETQTPYSDLVNWIGGTNRDHAIEIFTTNYDLLFEKALERARVPYFDGFTGSSEPFFDASTISSDDLPPRWVRLWKLHGSIGWKSNGKGEVIRDGQPSSAHLVFPEHLKYEQTQKAPYSALFDRLRQFLMTPDTLLVATGTSFADAHVAARIDECLAANPSASVFAFQYRALNEEAYASSLASRRPNMSVYCPDSASIGGVRAAWQPGELPTRDWGPIRETYWGQPSSGTDEQFLLGSFSMLARFFASSRSTQCFSATPPVPASAVTTGIGP
jgi:hypothetical protein